MRRAQLTQHHMPGTPFILVGLKLDLVNDGSAPRAITYEQGEAIARELGAAAYLECSSKTRQGVDQVFEAAVAAVVGGGSSRRKRSRAAAHRSGCVLQ